MRLPYLSHHKTASQAITHNTHTPLRPHIALQWASTNGLQAYDLNPFNPARSMPWDGVVAPRSNCLTRPNVQLSAGYLDYVPTMDFATSVSEEQLMAMLQQVLDDGGF